MRKIMMIATLLAASSAFAGGEQRVRVVPQDEGQIQETAPVRQGRDFAAPIQFRYVGFTNGGMIKVTVMLGNKEVTFLGDDRNYGNAAGHGQFVISSLGYDGLTGNYSDQGSFARVGDAGFLIEIRDGRGGGIATLLRKSNAFDVAGM